MPISLIEYTQIPQLMLAQQIDWANDTIIAALVTDAYTSSTAHDEWADASANEVVDASYSAQTIASKTILVDRMDCGNPVWTSLTATFRYVVFYAQKTTTTPVLTNPLIVAVDLGANQSVAGVDWELPINRDGFFSYT